MRRVLRTLAWLSGAVCVAGLLYASSLNSRLEARRVGLAKVRRAQKTVRWRIRELKRRVDDLRGL